MNTKNNFSAKTQPEEKGNDFTRITGARIEMLRRFINRTAKDAKTETWDKIYTSLKPYLVGAEAESENEPPPRLGPAYRRHHELVAMTSDQKVLLDEFAMLSDSLRREILKKFAADSGDAPASAFTSLSAEENRLMGYFTALPPEKAEENLLHVTRIAVEELKRLRRELL